MRKYNILSDLVMVRSIQPVVYKQYDNGDNLEVELYEDGAKINLSTETVLAFFELPDGTVVQKTCGIQNGNAIATLDNNILSQSGNLKVEFTVYKNGNETTTRAIFITVEESINRNEAITTTPKWDIVQQVLAFDVQEATNAINNLKSEVNNLKLVYKDPVANFASLVTTYPGATVGWFAQTLDDGKYYRHNGVSWQFHSQVTGAAISEIQNKLLDQSRQSQLLSHGIQVINATQNSPLDLEIQGRTLTSLGNSNLEGNKNYVLADKRTKVRAEGREGTQYSGVSKFVKSASVVIKADFVGKVAGSITENPHIMKVERISTLMIPTSGFEVFDSKVTSLNNSSYTWLSNGSNQIAQQLFSFNIIEQIERKLGRIPSDTVAGKVQWIKDNVNRLTANWHGWGSSVGGNGATLQGWNGSGWSIFGSNTSGIVAKLSSAFPGAWLTGNAIDVNGIVHLLAHTTNPSDGTTPSQLNTDFVELEIELKSTAILDTRPIITRVANFEGKVSGSVVENPHTVTNGGLATLVTPSVSMSTWGMNQANINNIFTINGLNATVSANTNGHMAQHLFHFNLIEEIERNIGRIPKSSVAEKVQWLKDNVELSFDWYGFGSSIGGNKATVVAWYGSGWALTHSHTSSGVSKLQRTPSTSAYIQSDGNIHFLAYAEPSDGTTASTINTDYVELQISLKQGATLFDPVVPLYEVDATEYANILTTWDEANVLNRYPRVQGVQHLQNLAVIAEGENLLPPFSEWVLHANAKMLSPYELELNATGAFQGSYVEFRVVGGQVCTLSGVVDSNKYYAVTKLDSNNVQIGIKQYLEVGASSMTFTLESNVVRLKIEAQNKVAGKFTFTNPMLTLGSTPKPFVPRNPSYLFAPVKLGQIGSVKDSLFQTDGQWMMRKIVEKDVVLDGSLAWVVSTDYTGYKSVMVSNYLSLKSLTVGPTTALKHSGSLLKEVMSSGQITNGDQIHGGTSNLLLTISDVDSGWGESYTPTSDDIKRYFNGWKYTDGTTWTSVTGNGQTANASVALSTKPTDFTPYKLSYVLATPQLINVTDKVEGAISVSGPTQVEVTSGVIVREKVVPQYSSTGKAYLINEKGINASAPDSPLKHKTDKIMAIYKNGQKDTQYPTKTLNANQNGAAYGEIPEAYFDTTAEYTVTYLVLDRHLHTTNATEVKASYAGNFKEVQDMQVEKVSDLAIQQSVLANQMYRVLVAAKGAGWNV
jgi:hypothetical protein